MIEVQVTQLFAILLSAVAVFAGFVLVCDRLRDFRAARLARRDATRCRVCAGVYRPGGSEPVASCPHCGSSNPRGRDRRLG